MTFRRGAAYALFALALLVRPLDVGASADQTSVHTIASFDQALERTADQLDAAAVTARATPRHLGRVPRVELPPAPLGMPISSGLSLDRWLQAQMKRVGAQTSANARAQSLSDIAASLRRAAQSGAGHSPAQEPGPAVAAILAGNSYDLRPPKPVPAAHESIVQRIVDYIGRLLGELIKRVFGATMSTPVIGQIVAALYVALVAGLAAYLVYLLVVFYLRRRRRVDVDEGTPLLQRADPDVLYELGLTAASHGRYAQAVSLLFQASLAALDWSGKLPYDGSLTAGEYRRAVRRTVDAAAPYFDEIARAFVLAAFAERPVSADEFQATDAAYRSLRPLVVG